MTSTKKRAYRKITAKILKEAVQIRKTGCYTMREIAEKLQVNREDLIAELSKVGIG